jgi:hypothetical protein
MCKMLKRQTANKGFCGISSGSQQRLCGVFAEGEDLLAGEDLASPGETPFFPGPHLPSYTLGIVLNSNIIKYEIHCYETL